MSMMDGGPGLKKPEKVYHFYDRQQSRPDTVRKHVCHFYDKHWHQPGTSVPCLWPTAVQEA
eukprot:10728452-Lingulodinium_polyedra.AAC.1